MPDLKIKVGTEETRVEVLSNGYICFITEPEVDRTIRKSVSVEDSALLVLHLIRELSVFSDKSFHAVEDDVAEFQGRLVRNQRVVDLMKKLSARHFKKDLTMISNGEFALVRRAAEAEIDVLEAQAKL